MKNWLVGLHVVVSCVGAVSGYRLVVGIIGEQVVLPCTYNASQVVAVSDLRVMWQREGNKVVHAQYGEREETNYQDARFKDRTRVSAEKMARGDLSLVLGSMRVADEGVYSCIVLKFSSGARTKEQQTSVSLVAAAHYSDPVISREEDIRPGQEVNLTCRSSGGYPKPTVDWTDGEGNSLLGNSPVVTSLESDPVTRLWNVTSVLRVKATINSTFTCSVDNNRTPDSKTPAQWTYPNQDSSPRHENKTVPIVAGVFIAGALALTVGLILHMKLKRRQKRYSVANGQDKGLAPHPTATDFHEMEVICLNEDHL